MKSLLTEELYKLGFLCGIEQEIYIRDTGKYTSLIIEGDVKEVMSYMAMIFINRPFIPTIQTWSPCMGKIYQLPYC